MLRHPVVLTSLEEDFRKFGLIKEDESRDEKNYPDDLEGSPEEQNPVSDTEEAGSEDPFADDESESDDGDLEMGEDEDIVSEALEFHESFKARWDQLGVEGVETITLSDEDMEELEGFAEEQAELDLSYISDHLEEGFGYDEDMDDAEEEDDSEVSPQDEDSKTSLQVVAESLKSIEAMIQNDDTSLNESNSWDEIIPAFSNIALIAEKLQGFFLKTFQETKDSDYKDMYEAYGNIGKYSAGIVDTLQQEDPDTIDVNALSATYQDYLSAVLEGVEVYTMLRNPDDSEVPEEEDAREEDDEGNE